MSILKVDTINEKTSGNGVTIAANTTFSETKAVVAELGGITFGTANTFQTIGSITIPTSGLWMVRTDLRLRTTGSGFINARLIDASSNEIQSSAGTATRMLAENIDSPTSFNNIHVAAGWLLDMPTGLSYGSNITLQCQPTTAATTNAIINDVNGIPVITAIKINTTSTTGSTVTTLVGSA